MDGYPVWGDVREAGAVEARIAAAVLAEREACARAVEDACGGPCEAAAAIRARTPPQLTPARALIDRLFSAGLLAPREQAAARMVADLYRAAEDGAEEGRGLADLLAAVPPAHHSALRLLALGSMPLETNPLPSLRNALDAAARHLESV